jgi:hypothetical protein
VELLFTDLLSRRQGTLCLLFRQAQSPAARTVNQIETQGYHSAKDKNNGKQRERRK